MTWHYNCMNQGVTWIA